MCDGRFEAVTQNPIEHKKHELRTLCERRGVERPALFGSALRDDFDPEKSDLDYSVEFSPVSPERHAEAYFGLLDDLEGLFGRRAWTSWRSGRSATPTCAGA